MTRIAFISDIHSNLPALEAVLKEIKKLKIEEIYCLGDLIGYHTFTNEVINLLRDEEVVSLKGNHDHLISESNFNRESEKDFPHYWNYDRLTPENLEYIKNLPEVIHIDREGVTIKLVHGSPQSKTEYIREGSEEHTHYLDNMETTILICAHTHLPYITNRYKKYLLNTGSVGKPKLGEPKASFLILTIDGETILPEICFTTYDTERMVSDLKKNNFPNKLIDSIKTGLP